MLCVEIAYIYEPAVGPLQALVMRKDMSRGSGMLKMDASFSSTFQLLDRLLSCAKFAFWKTPY